MSSGVPFEQIARDAADPNVDPHYLREIAAEYPGLRPVIAQNPSTYPALLEWLRSLHDPQVDQALAERDRLAAGGIAAGGIAAGGIAAATGAESAAAAEIDGSAEATGGNEAFATAASLPTQVVYNPGKQKRSRSKVWLLVAALIAAALVIGLCIALALGALNAPNKEPVTPAPTAEPTPAQTTETPAKDPTPAAPTPAAPTPDPTVEPVTKPAPANAVEMSEFVMPSQNIACRLTETGAFCAIQNRNFLKEGPNACLGTFGVRIPAQGPAVATCDDAEVTRLSDSFPTLDYGKAAKYADFACRSSSEGVNCWNIRTGVTMEMARRGFNFTQP